METGETTTAAPATGEAPQPEVRPADALAREKAAQRAKKHRALKKLKGAKDDASLKKAATEIAEGDDAEKSPWPSPDKIAAAYGETAALIATHVAPELVGTRHELTERKAQILCGSIAPLYAQIKNSPGALTPPAWLPPWLVALGGTLLVFGPGIYAELRDAMGDQKPQPAPQKPQLAPAPPEVTRAS